MSQPASSSNNRWIKIVIIVLVVVVVLCAVVACVAFVLVPLLLGPSVGNVFSSIVTSLPPTPTP
jgi:flagellar basal body-associated protein FliL